MTIGKMFLETYDETSGTLEFEFYPEALEISPVELTKKIEDILRASGFELDWSDDDIHKTHIVNIEIIHDCIEHVRRFVNKQRATCKVRKIRK